jgi:hypothetical protein
VALYSDIAPFNPEKGINIMAQSKAKFYIYWNLHKQCWSVKFKGKVIEHVYNTIRVWNAEYKVSEAGRLRVIKEKRKNVHAYVACSFYVVTETEPSWPTWPSWVEVYYNPYKVQTFVRMDDREPIYKSDSAVMTTWLNRPEVYAQK